MKDYLSDFCEKTNIKLVYTNNKFTVLSCSLSNNTACIRIHKIFENCPKKITNAIIDYISDTKNTANCLKLIKDFINEHFSSSKYKIITPSKEFKEFLINSTTPKTQNKKNKSDFVELNINKITKKDLLGNKSELNPKEAIHPSSDEILELDIELDYFT